MKLVRGLLVVAVLAATPFLLLQGMSNARMIPSPVSWNGFWQADVARAFLLAEENEGRIQLAVNERGLEMATDAYASEPFATDALFLMAVDHRANGDTEMNERIVGLGLALDKRNRQLGVLELEQAAVTGDYQQVFATLDRLTVTSPRLVSEFMPPLTAGIEQDPAALPIMRDALEAQPVWGEAFWNAVPRSAVGVSRFYELRLMTDAGTTAESDAELLLGLARQGFFTEVFAFWDSMDVGEGDAMSFMQSTDFAPVGWLVAQDGERSFSERGDGEFDIFVEEQTFGELARQLVRLQPGEYRFSAEVDPEIGGRDVGVSLECAGGDDDAPDARPVEDSPSWTVGGDCSIHWLVLTGSAWERRNSLQATISQMSFERLP